MDITFTLQSLSDGSLLTGQASNTTVYLSIDGAAFSASTNAAQEIGRGLYKVTLTNAESEFSTLYYQPVCSGAQTNLWSYDAPVTMPTVPTAADNAQAVWGAQTKIVNIDSTQASTLATAAALTTVGDNVTAVKAKTDNLPAIPAAVGSEMALTSAAISAVQNGLATSSELSALETHGDSYWHTASTAGLATGQGLENLATYGDSHWATATGFATPANVTDAVTALETYGDGKWQTADVSDLATSSELATAETNIVSAMPDISGLPTAADVWEYTDRTLTEEISVEISSENIADITESVWNADDRTLTDLTPKPNQKNIVCTPSNVINAYGIPRLENWTNETAGTQAFDDKINTYITLAKEKMTTDLNNHINAAIAYIGADNITELCAWLTGYNLYQDDESTDTDSLPETRYNQYLEQIHRIMENI